MDLNSQSSPVLLRYKRKQIPSAGIIVAVLVALLILFLWLHFILAQRIELAGREIQLKTEELHRIERHNHELRRKISIAGSQERLAERGEDLGYSPQQPVYLLVDRPLPPTTQMPWSSNLGLVGIDTGNVQALSNGGGSGPPGVSGGGN